MNKLREKLCSALPLFGRIEEQNIEKLEQITDDFTVAFAIFLRQKCLIDDNYLYYFFNGKKYNETELQQYFKENIYGK
jgi:hypothetical protein